MRMWREVEAEDNSQVTDAVSTSAKKHKRKYCDLSYFFLSIKVSFVNAVYSVLSAILVLGDEALPKEFDILNCKIKEYEPVQHNF